MLRWCWLGLVGCAGPQVVFDDPDGDGVVPGLVLAAELQPGGVRVQGAIVSDQFVDVDPVPDARWPFRVQVRDGSTVLYERTHPGPGVVDAFLGYWGDTAGIDLLGSLPTLGRFPVHVPVLEGADQVFFDLRDASGAWVPAGGFDLADAGATDLGVTDVAGVEALHTGGPSEHAVDLVILGDGYTEAEQAEFAEHADQVTRRLLAIEALAAFGDRINIWRVDVVSAESGASYDCRSCDLRDTAFGSIFPIEVVNRLTGSNYGTRAIFQTEQWGVAQAASAVPWDQVIVLVNTPKFGGMAVHYATATAVTGYGETAVHELGHVLGGLGDEYVFDDCVRSDALGLPPNITDRPQDPPWSHWIEAGTPLPTEGDGDEVGAYLQAYNCDDLYRPASECKMNGGGPFCPVCAEQLVRSVFRHGDPVTGEVRLDGKTLHVQGAAPGTVIRWFVDGELQGEAPAAPQIDVGRLRGAVVEIEAEVVTDLVRSHDGELVQRWSAPLD